MAKFARESLKNSSDGVALGLLKGLDEQLEELVKTLGPIATANNFHIPYICPRRNQKHSTITKLLPVSLKTKTILKSHIEFQNTQARGITRRTELINGLLNAHNFECE